jgi:tRNA modification GTPase
VEISAHGSSYILQTICSLLIQHGCQPAAPGEYTQRAFLNGKLDLTQAEAVADLIASQNASQHRVAMQQMRGGISQKLSDLRAQLLKLTSLLELELDFSEEDVEFASREALINIAQEVRDEITRLSSSFSTGNAIKNGIPVAIIGAPNVGKSTLLNALLHEDKAIVSDIQGTTRDTIEDCINISGILFRIIDTAGIRHTEDTIEKMGIERSRKAAERAQIIILMRDNDTDYPTLDIRDGQTVIKVHNKSEDFQALTGKGMDWLELQLLNSVPTANDDEVLITNIRHKQALDISLLDIQRTLDALEQNLPGDLIAEDLRQCLTHLGQILGQITTDEVLGNIFKNFCVGK